MPKMVGEAQTINFSTSRLMKPTNVLKKALNSQTG